MISKLYQYFIQGIKARKNNKEKEENLSDVGNWSESVKLLECEKNNNYDYEGLKTEIWQKWRGRWVKKNLFNNDGRGNEK